MAYFDKDIGPPEDKRRKTKEARATAFEAEQREFSRRIKVVVGAVEAGDFLVALAFLDLVKVSVECLLANDPRKEMA